MKSTHDQEGRCILPILHTAGGLVGGDSLEFKANLNENTKVLLTTSSAQKVYGTVGRSKINPDGIDLSSGVEESLGIKSEIKIKNFINKYYAI